MLVVFNRIYGCDDLILNLVINCSVIFRNVLPIRESFPDTNLGYVPLTKLKHQLNLNQINILAM